MRRLLLLLLMLLSLEFAHAGTDPRLQQALSNWQQGQTLTVAVIGGSITTGYAASPRQQGWAGQLQRWLLAQPGRTSSASSMLASAARIPRPPCSA